MEIEVKAMSEPFMDLKFWSARWSQQRIRLGKGPGNRLPQQETGGRGRRQRGFVFLVTTKWGAVSAERFPVCDSTPSLA